MSALPVVFKTALALLVAAAAIYDCKYRKIPNWLSLSGLILGFGLNILFFGTAGLFSSGEGMLLAFAVYLPLFMIKGMGAGDVKLMAALGSLVGPSNWFEIFLATALFGGLAAAFLAWTKKRFNETCWNVIGILSDLLHMRAPYRSNVQLDIRDARALRMPHAVTIAIGSVSFLFFSSLLRFKLFP